MFFSNGSFAFYMVAEYILFQFLVISAVTTPTVGDNARDFRVPCISSFVNVAWRPASTELQRATSGASVLNQKSSAHVEQLAKNIAAKWRSRNGLLKKV